MSGDADSGKARNALMRLDSLEKSQIQSKLGAESDTLLDLGGLKKKQQASKAQEKAASKVLMDVDSLQSRMEEKKYEGSLGALLNLAGLQDQLSAKKLADHVQEKLTGLSELTSSLFDHDAEGEDLKCVEKDLQQALAREVNADANTEAHAAMEILTRLGKVQKASKAANTLAKAKSVLLQLNLLHGALGGASWYGPKQGDAEGTGTPSIPTGTVAAGAGQGAAETEEGARADAEQEGGVGKANSDDGSTLPLPSIAVGDSTETANAGVSNEELAKLKEHLTTLESVTDCPEVAEAVRVLALMAPTGEQKVSNSISAAQQLELIDGARESLLSMDALQDLMEATRIDEIRARTTSDEVHAALDELDPILEMCKKNEAAMPQRELALDIFLQLNKLQEGIEYEKAQKVLLGMPVRSPGTFMEEPVKEVPTPEEEVIVDEVPVDVEAGPDSVGVPDYKKFFHEIPGKAMQLVNGDRATLWLHFPSTNTLWTMRDDQLLHCPSDEGLIGYSASAKEVLNSKSRFVERLYQLKVDNLEDDYLTFTSLVAPIMCGEGTVQAVLAVTNKVVEFEKEVEDAFFSDDDLAALVDFCTSVAEEVTGFNSDLEAWSINPKVNLLRLYLHTSQLLTLVAQQAVKVSGSERALALFYDPASDECFGTTNAGMRIRVPADSCFLKRVVQGTNNRAPFVCNRLGYLDEHAIENKDDDYFRKLGVTKVCAVPTITAERPNGAIVLLGSRERFSNESPKQLESLAKLTSIRYQLMAMQLGIPEFTASIFDKEKGPGNLSFRTKKKADTSTTFSFGRPGGCKFSLNVNLAEGRNMKDADGDLLENVHCHLKIDGNVVKEHFSKPSYDSSGTPRFFEDFEFKKVHPWDELIIEFHDSTKKAPKSTLGRVVIPLLKLRVQETIKSWVPISTVGSSRKAQKINGNIRLILTLALLDKAFAYDDGKADDTARNPHGDPLSMTGKKGRNQSMPDMRKSPGGSSRIKGRNQSAHGVGPSPATPAREPASLRSRVTRGVSLTGDLEVQAPEARFDNDVERTSLATSPQKASRTRPDDGIHQTAVAAQLTPHPPAERGSRRVTPEFRSHSQGEQSSTPEVFHHKADVNKLHEELELLKGKNSSQLAEIRKLKAQNQKAVQVSEDHERKYRAYIGKLLVTAPP